MRFRQQQSEAQTASRRLLLWFAVLVAALVVAVNAALAGLYKLILGTLPFPAYFWATNTGVVLLLVAGGAWLETERLRSGGGALVARWAGGGLLSEPRDGAERRLLNVVDEMALASGLPRPAVYLLEREPGINAFVAGWTPQEAALAVTRGALQRLTRDELQGLVAHEFGHIREGDLPLNMRLLALVWGLSLVHGLGVELMQPDDEGRRPALSLVGAVLRTLGGLGWLAGRVLQAAVSRQREHLADACAVQFTRSRDGLGDTLRKVWFLQRQPEGRLASPHAEALAALLLDDGPRRRWLATHPPLPERIHRITGRPATPLPAPCLDGHPDDEPWPLGAAAGAAASVPQGVLSTVPPGVIAALPPGALAAGCDAAPAGRAMPAMPRADAPVAPHPPSGSVTRAVAPDAAAAPMAARLDPYATPGEDTGPAVGRLLRLHGPAERRAGLLACCLPLERPARVQAWRDAARGLAHAHCIAGDVAQLPPRLRLQVRESLLARTRAAPSAERRAARLALRRLLAAEDELRALDLLRYACAVHRLQPAERTCGERRDAPSPGAAAAALMHGPWAALIRAAQCDGDAVLPRSLADLHALRRHARDLRRLPMMGRPAVFKAWRAAPPDAGRAPDRRCAEEVAWLLAELLDVPRPDGE